jgi:hypothetical protein
VDKNFLSSLVVHLVVAIVVYALAVQLAFWQIPRRKHALPGTLVAFLGSIVGWELFARFAGGVSTELLGSALGALAFVFAAVKVGTPASVVLTVDTEGASGSERERRELRREGFHAPFVWPPHFSVEKYGTVVFELVGKTGTEVEIEFPDNTPFGSDGEGKPRRVFAARVPARINASPVLVPGRGKYVVRKKDPDTGETIVNDPTWDTPRRKD